MQMKKAIVWSIAVLVLAVAGFYVALSHLTKPAPIAPPPPLAVSPVPTVAPTMPAPVTHYPLATDNDSKVAQESLPNLENSDPALLSALSALINKRTITAFFYPDEIIRRIVATIDNLPRETIAVQLRPVKPVDGRFLVEEKGVTLSIAPANAERYAPYVKVVQEIDAKKLVALYRHFYPLFQQQYQDLGYPTGYFNDRLIAVIDHLLACPEAPATVDLVQPHVAYGFADSNLEHGSAGDKILMRIGNEKAEKVKGKLREIRRELTGK